MRAPNVLLAAPLLRGRDAPRTLQRAARALEAGRLPSGAWSAPKAVRSLTGAGLGPASVNRALAALSGVWRLMHEHGSACEPPRFRRLREPAGRQRSPDRHEVALMLHGLRRIDPDSARQARVLWRTGLRVGELERAELQEGALVLALTKNGDPRRVPVPTACRATARALLARPVPPSTFGLRWRQAREAAGLGSWLVPHSLRHARASALVLAGVPVPVVAAALGHRSWRSTQRYTHATESAVAEAMEAR